MRTLPYVIHKKDSSALLEAIFRRGTLPVRSHRTIEEFSSYWFKNVAHHVRASSLINYRRRFIHIIAKLGKVDLADLTRAQVAQFAVDLLQRGYARGTVFGIVSSLREMYFDAMEYGEAFYNPAANIERILRLKNERRPIQPFNQQEAARFLRFARIYEPHYYPVFLCALTTGMRSGELLGLRARDIDFAEHLIHVRSSLAGKELTLPKNYKVRRVDMNKRLATVLWKYLQWKRARALELEHDKPLEKRRTEAELFTEIMGKPLFTRLYGGQLARYDLEKFFKRTIKRAGLRHARIHDLRHTYVTLLIQQGESLAYIRDQLGHFSIRVTVDTYGHLIPGSNRSALDRLVNSLENRKLSMKRIRHSSVKAEPYRARKSDNLKNWT